MKAIKCLSIFMLTILLLASCKKTGYENCIPADATLVVSVDLNSLSDKADLKNSHISDVMDKYLGLVVFGEGLTKVKDYMNRPETIGIDFRDPAYIFMTTTGYVGASFNVHDEGLLKEFVETLAKQDLCSKPNEKEGYFAGNMLEDIQYGFNGNTLLLIAPLESEATNARKVVSQLIAQKRDDSYASTALFDKMQGMNDKDIVIYSNFGVVNQEVREMFATVIPRGVRPSEIELFGSMTFENGRACLSARLEGSNPKVQNVLEEFDKNFYKIKGRYINSADANSLVWCGLGVNGDWLLNVLKKDNDIKQTLYMMDRAIDIEAMVRDIDGDVAFSMPMTSFDSNVSMPPFSINAQIKTASFLADVDDWKESQKDYGIEMTNKGQDTYAIKYDDMTLTWGVKDKDLFFTHQMGQNANSTFLKDYESEIKDNVVYVIVDVQKLGLRNAVDMPEFLGFGKKIDLLKSLIIKARTSHEWEVDVDLSDKSENFLRMLL